MKVTEVVVIKDRENPKKLRLLLSAARVKHRRGQRTIVVDITASEEFVSSAGDGTLYKLMEPIDIDDESLTASTASSGTPPSAC